MGPTASRPLPVATQRVQFLRKPLKNALITAVLVVSLVVLNDTEKIRSVISDALSAHSASSPAESLPLVCPYHHNLTSSRYQLSVCKSPERGLVLGIHCIVDNEGVSEGLYLDFRDYVYIWQATDLRRRILREVEELRSAVDTTTA